MKNLLLPAVNRGDLRRLNYNKTVFGRGSATDPAGRAHDAFPDPRVGWKGDTSSPFSSALASGPKRASFFFWIGTPTFLDQRYALKSSSFSSCSDFYSLTHYFVISYSDEVVLNYGKSRSCFLGIFFIHNHNFHYWVHGISTSSHFSIHSVIDHAIYCDSLADDAAAESAQRGRGDFRNLVDNFDFHNSKSGNIPDTGQIHSRFWQTTARWRLHVVM